MAGWAQALGPPQLAHVLAPPADFSRALVIWIHALPQVFTRLPCKRYAFNMTDLIVVLSAHGGCDASFSVKTAGVVPSIALVHNSRR